MLAIILQKERNDMPDDLIKCKMCAALFCNKRAYNIHNAYHQPDDLYVSSEKQRTQMVTKIDQDFDIRRVQALADKYMPRSNVFNRTIDHRTKVKHIFFHILSYILRLLIIPA